MSIDEVDTTISSLRFPLGVNVENPITHNRIKFLQTPSTENEGVLEYELTIAPGFHGRLFELERRHPRQQEILTVLSGSIRGVISDQYLFPKRYAEFRRDVNPEGSPADVFEPLEITEGHGLVIPPGAFHHFQNGMRDAETRVLVRHIPPLDTEQYIKRGYEIAADNARGSRARKEPSSGGNRGGGGRTDDGSEDGSEVTTSTPTTESPSHSEPFRRPGEDDDVVRRSDSSETAGVRVPETAPTPPSGPTVRTRSFRESFSSFLSQPNGRRAVGVGMILNGIASLTFIGLAFVWWTVFLLPLVIVNAYLIRLARAGMKHGEVPSFEAFGKLLRRETRAEWKPYLVDGAKVTALSLVAMSGAGLALLPGGLMILSWASQNWLGSLVAWSVAFWVLTVFVMAVAHGVPFVHFVRFFTFFPIALNPIYLRGFAKALAVWLPLVLLQFALATWLGASGAILGGILIFPAYAALYYYLGECWMAARVDVAGQRKSRPAETDPVQLA